MKKHLVMAILGCVALATVLLAMSCDQGSSSVNSGGGQNANMANANKPVNANAVADDTALWGDDGACDESNPISNRRDKVYEKIKYKIEHSSLADQYAAKTFDFNVVVASGNGANSLQLFFAGAVYGVDNFEVLEKISKNFVKKKCASRVMYFKKGQMPTGPVTSAAPVGVGDYGFEWTACDYPNVPCPGGECIPPGTSCAMPSPGVNGNTNSKTKSNDNTGSNRP